MEVLPISEWVWNARYRHIRENSEAESDLPETWRRVARAVACAEQDRDQWQAAFSGILDNYLFLPGGRVLAGAGTGERVTLFNCFAAGPLLDSVESILDSLKEAAVTMQQGGGIGCDFSPLRPSGAVAIATGSIASGPLPFMHIWNSLCETLLGTSNRRGAMMGTLRCDHPDIEAFINAKRQRQELKNFNLSVLITDDFMRAVTDDAEWRLIYPALPAMDHADPAIGEDAGQVYRRLPAQDLWRQIIEAAHETAEPGLLFIDTINRNNNLYYCETIGTTNPCGEIPLPPYGACNLGSVNLTALVQAPFTAGAKFNRQKLQDTVRIAARFLDDVIDVSRFPLEEQARQAHGTRRIGIGITGLADILAMLRLDYDSDTGRAFAQNIMEMIRNTAYETSVDLARERGAFPFFDKDRYLEAPFILRLPAQLQAGISKHGIRNSHLLAIAPAGTISLLAGNVSSGIEPIYALEGTREVRGRDLEIRRFDVRDYAYQRWQATADKMNGLPESFVTTDTLSARAHLAMQACLQPYVDNAISKTVNLPADATLGDVEEVFSDAWTSGLKGCTVFRPGARCGQVLRTRNDAHCCHDDREAD